MDLIHWKVSAIIRETADTFSFVLVPAEQVSYRAGQFLTFLFNRNGTEIRRSYSISTAPGIDPDITVTVKRLANGEVSRLLTDHAQVGDTLVSLRPAGRFTIETSTLSGQYFFIAAGSGIVPVISLIKELLVEKRFPRILLISQNHHESTVIFHDSLQSLQQQYPMHFTWISLLSAPLSRIHPASKLNNMALENLVLSHLLPGERMFYLCGPPSFMRMAQFTLKWMGFSDLQIRKEYFTLGQRPSPPMMADRKPKKVKLRFNGQSFHFQTAYPDSILQSALQANIHLPYSCRAGRCSSCIAKCLLGKVSLANNEILTDRDLQNGLVLTCVGYAETDVELEC